jgi:4-hydroxy-tetrahydrodipicolinate synthase
MLQGSYVALVTPFRKNEIDYNAFENLLNFHLDNGTDGILLCGTTGESPALASDEKERLVQYGIRVLDGRLPVMMSTGTNNLHHTISATIKAQNWGVNYALVITPYYNKPTQNGLYLYFKAVAEQTDIPIVIYNVPGRTGVNISAETTVRLAHDFPSIVGIKEASGDLVQVSQIVRDAPETFTVMSGEDALNYPIMACGAKGAISVTANVLPKQVHELTDVTLKGKHKKAVELHKALLLMNQAMFYETNPMPVKEALAAMKMIEPEIRMPLCRMQEHTLQQLLDVLKQYNVLQG